jgi:hypothetical protein
VAGLAVETAPQTPPTTNPFANVQPATVDGAFGQTSADPVKRSKFALGFPQAAITGRDAPVGDAHLKSEKPLAPGYQRTRQQRLAASTATTSIRTRIVT